MDNHLGVKSVRRQAAQLVKRKGSEVVDCSYLEENLKNLKEEIKRVCDGCGRDEAEILLMPAVKYADAEQINYIHSLGVNDIGENRVQQLLEHLTTGLDRDGLNIHFIGSLQTNKVKYIIDKVCLIHSLDSDKLAREIDKQAKKHGIVMDVLVEINSGGEESKGGVAPKDVEEFCLEIQKYKNIRLRGFMTMAPKCADRSMYHKYFGDTRETGEKIWYGTLKKTTPPILSMGMSDSFREAITEGSTLIRVGSNIFKNNNNIK